jgi:hypothetical protein
MAATLNCETNGLWDIVSGEIGCGRPDGCVMAWIIECHFGSGTGGKPMHEYSLREAIWQTMDMECSDPHHAQVNIEKLRKIKRLLEDPKITKEQMVEAIIKHPMIYDLRVGCLGSMQNDARDIPIPSTELMSRTVNKLTIQIAEDGRRSDSTINTATMSGTDTAERWVPSDKHESSRTGQHKVFVKKIRDTFKLSDTACTKCGK